MSLIRSIEKNLIKRGAVVIGAFVVFCSSGEIYAQLDTIWSRKYDGGYDDWAMGVTSDLNQDIRPFSKYKEDAPYKIVPLFHGYS